MAEFAVAIVIGLAIGGSFFWALKDLDDYLNEPEHNDGPGGAE